MIEEIKNLKSEKKDLRRFGITIGVLLFVIAAVLFWREKESFRVMLITGILFFAAGMAVPIMLKPVFLIWMTFAIILGWFMTRLILSILFYLIFTPIGLLLRLFGKRFIDLDWQKEDATYWHYRAQGVSDKEKYERQF